MKKILAIFLSAIMVLSALALAEGMPAMPGNGQPPQMPTGTDGTQPSDGFGASDGTQASGGFDGAQGFGDSNGMQAPEGFGGFDGAQPPQGFGGFDSEQPSGGFGGFGGGSAEGQLGSWSGGDSGDYDYDAAVFIRENSIDETKSAAERVAGGTVSETEAANVVIDDAQTHREGIVVLDADYTIRGASITMLTTADGTDTCDFSGIGSGVAVFGDGNVTIEDSTIETAGVAVTPIFVDGGATVTVRNSTLISRGGTLHADYMNSPDQAVMVAPPWILGIMGTSRCTNLMGTNSTLNVIDSDTSSGAWAVLSTDAGTKMALNIVNTSLTLLNGDESAAAPLQAEGGQIYATLDNPYTANYGSGYGTFAIGSAKEVLAGAKLNVGTYATILTGGEVKCLSLKAGETIELPQANGTTLSYTPAEDCATVINSDTFGFMAHQNSNRVELGSGTQLNTGDASFLIKTGYSNETFAAEIDNATIRNGGVLIQVMDNDDATNGGMMAATDPANTNGGVQNFIPKHTEEKGFSTKTGVISDSVQTFSFASGAYSGNIYNASGSDRSTASNGLNAAALNVTFGPDSEYSGAVASTSAIHVTFEGAQALKAAGSCALETEEDANAFAEAYQNLSFDITHYFDIGHVANKIFFNGGNTINMTLTDNAVWHVTGTSLISSLTIRDNAQVIVPADVTLTVNGQTYTDCVLTAETL